MIPYFLPPVSASIIVIVMVIEMCQCDSDNSELMLNLREGNKIIQAALEPYRRATHCGYVQELLLPCQGMNQMTTLNKSHSTFSQHMQEKRML